MRAGAGRQVPEAYRVGVGVQGSDPHSARPLMTARQREKMWTPHTPPSASMGGLEGRDHPGRGGGRSRQRENEQQKERRAGEERRGRRGRGGEAMKNK